jgi:hypothetical protein
MGVPGIGWIPEHGDAGRLRHHFPQQLQFFPHQLVRDKSWSGDVASRPREAGDESGRHWISRTCENDRNLLGRSSGSLSRRHASTRHDDVDLQTDELRGKVEKPFGLPLCPSVLNRDALTFHMAELAKRLPEEIDSTLGLGIRPGIRR